MPETRTSSEVNSLEAQFADLGAGQKGLNELQKFVTSQAEKLFPLVLGHFNAFVRTSLNDKLPEGYVLHPTQTIDYDSNSGTFSLRAGMWTTPKGKGLVPDPRDPESIEVYLTQVDAYTKSTSWIGHINPAENPFAR